jgi:hypothetical protein
MGLIRLSKFQNVHLGQNVLKVILNTLTLEETKGPIAFVDMRLEGFSQTKPRPGELNTQVSVGNGSLDLHH